MDAKLHADAIHRGAGQIIPPSRRAMFACQIKSETRLLEPMNIAEIRCPKSKMSGVYKCLNKRRAKDMMENADEDEDNADTMLKALLPVSESFGFTAELR